MKIMTCSKCAEEFELEDGKPGFASVCLPCSVPTPEQRARLLADYERRRKSLVAAVQTNIRHYQQEREIEATRERLGFKAVPGRKFIIRVPK